MLGIDRDSGQTLSGWPQLVSRVQQVMSTAIGSRHKRRNFGSRLPQLLAKNVGDQQLLLAQSYAIEAFYNPANGLLDIKPLSCLASRHKTGIHLAITGQWQRQLVNLEVVI